MLLMTQFKYLIFQLISTSGTTRTHTQNMRTSVVSEFIVSEVIKQNIIIKNN